MRTTLKQIAVEYGAVAVAVYLMIFALALVGFWAAIRLGWSARGAAANAGAWTAAYLATKVTQPLRIVATVAITPFVARLYDGVMRRGSAPPSSGSTASPRDGA